MTPTETGTRPRVEGERELEILEATLEVLDEVGYDLLTMDAVAARAQGVQGDALPPLERASPSSSSPRSWRTRAQTVVPDTGTLRGDLLGAYCGSGGLNDPLAQSVLAAVVTAMGRDPEFAEVYRRDFIGPEGRASAAASTSAPATAARSTPTSTSSILAPAARRDRPAPRVPARRDRHAPTRRARARRGHPPRRLHGPCLAPTSHARSDPLSDPSDPLEPTRTSKDIP